MPGGCPGSSVDHICILLLVRMGDASVPTPLHTAPAPTENERAMKNECPTENERSMESECPTESERPMGRKGGSPS